MDPAKACSCRFHLGAACLVGAGISILFYSSFFEHPTGIIDSIRTYAVYFHRAGGELVSVKAHKEFRAEIGDTVSFSVPVSACHLFHEESGERLAA